MDPMGVLGNEKSPQKTNMTWLKLHHQPFMYLNIAYIYLHLPYKSTIHVYIYLTFTIKNSTIPL